MTIHATCDATLGIVHIVLPFFADETGGLRPGAPRRSLSRRNAIALADGLAPFYEGVLVLRDADQGCDGRHAGRGLVCVIGDVPGEVVRQLAA